MFASLVLTLAAVPQLVFASERLIMITSDRCPYCKAWERDVGAIYAESPYAQNLPLTRVKLSGAMPDGLVFDASITGTPTFVVFRGGLEIDRQLGYQSSEMFWWWLSEHVD